MVHVLSLALLTVFSAAVQNEKLVDKIKVLAKKKGCTPGQLALAWVHHQGDDVFPIPGTKNIKYLEENIAAVAVQLSKEEMSELEDAVPHNAVSHSICVHQHIAVMPAIAHCCCKHQEICH